MPHNRAVEFSNQPKPYLAAPGEGIQTNWITLGYSVPSSALAVQKKKKKLKMEERGEKPQRRWRWGYGKLPMLTELSPCRDSNLN